jgi:type I restriction enzyme R subunit
MKGRGSEWRLAEKPTLEYLVSLGYEFIDPGDHEKLRGSQNQVLFKPHLIDAIERLNGISRADAEAAAAELSRKEDNEEWLALMRGAFSRQVEGQSTHRTIKLIDFENPSNNQLGSALIEATR